MGHISMGVDISSDTCRQIFYYLGLAIVFIYEGNPSKIFQMASNSFEVTDVSF